MVEAIALICPIALGTSAIALRKSRTTYCDHNLIVIISVRWSYVVAPLLVVESCLLVISKSEESQKRAHS